LESSVEDSGRTPGGVGLCASPNKDF
jgi:hypothetical protein